MWVSKSSPACSWHPSPSWPSPWRLCGRPWLPGRRLAAMLSLFSPRICPSQHGLGSPRVGEAVNPSHPRKTAGSQALPVDLTLSRPADHSLSPGLCSLTCVMPAMPQDCWWRDLSCSPCPKQEEPGLISPWCGWEELAGAHEPPLWASLAPPKASVQNCTSPGSGRTVDQLGTPTPGRAAGMSSVYLALSSPGCMCSGAGTLFVFAG